jgi:hypothetical protein
MDSVCRFSDIDHNAKHLIIEHLTTTYGVDHTSIMHAMNDFIMSEAKNPISPISDSTVIALSLDPCNFLTNLRPIIFYMVNSKNDFIRFWYNKVTNQYIASFVKVNASGHTSSITLEQNAISAWELGIRKINAETWPIFIQQVLRILRSPEEIYAKIQLNNIMLHFFGEIKTISPHYCIPYADKTDEIVVSGVDGIFRIIYDYTSTHSIKRIDYNSDPLSALSSYTSRLSL